MPSGLKIDRSTIGLYMSVNPALDAIVHPSLSSLNSHNSHNKMDPNNNNNDLPDMLPPLRLDFQQDDRTIIAPTLGDRYLMRQIGSAWFQIMENTYPNAAIGTRILVRRDVIQPPSHPFNVIHDYVTIRVNQPTLYGDWVHVHVAYPANENSPYPFDVDGYHNREELFRRMPVGLPALPAVDVNNHQEPELTSSMLLSPW